MSTILTLKTHGYVGAGYNQKVSDSIPTYSNKVSLNGRPFFQDVVIDGLRLPFEPILTISGSKKIVETVLAGSGRRGTVKELISDNDYKITLEGMLMGEKKYPTDDINALLAVINKQESVEFESVLSDLFGIEKVVIKDYKFPHTKGELNQAYSISLVSDIDFLAEIKLSDL